MASYFMSHVGRYINRKTDIIKQFIIERNSLHNTHN